MAVTASTLAPANTRVQKYVSCHLKKCSMDTATEEGKFARFSLKVCERGFRSHETNRESKIQNTLEVGRSPIKIQTGSSSIKETGHRHKHFTYWRNRLVMRCACCIVHKMMSNRSRYLIDYLLLSPQKGDSCVMAMCLLVQHIWLQLDAFLGLGSSSNPTMIPIYLARLLFPEAALEVRIKSWLDVIHQLWHMQSVVGC